MARGTCTFKQSDVTKALRAAKDAGFCVSSFEIDRDGKILVVTAKPVGDPNTTIPSETDLGL